LGYDLPDAEDRRAIQGLLDRVRGKPESFAVNLACLRSMQQAEYSPKVVGHYALASDHYCHFTSPIRRYPDLTVHRLIDHLLAGELQTAVDRRRAQSEETLLELGAHCSANERRAEAAERELRLVLVLRLLEGQLGITLKGVVTGVANVGIFVQLERYLIEGLLKFDSLPDDWWEVDAAHGAIIGQRSGRRIEIGDRMRVTIARIHLPTRQLDLAPAEPEDFSVVSTDPGSPAQPRKAQRTARAAVTKRSRSTRKKRSARGRRPARKRAR
jgi:ribonuclease R